VIRLERDGLVARRPDPTDARAVLVAITDDGRDRLAALRAARADRIQERLRALDPDQRDALEAALPALSALVSPGVSTTS
jgi:DNA-binding MarR family transcriptional regulator